MVNKFVLPLILSIIFGVHEMECTHNVATLDNLAETERIVEGELAEEMEFPFMVAILLWFDDNYEFHCGGSLINLEFVLTAAHCVKGIRTTDFLLQLGTVELWQKHSTYRTVVKRWYHKQFNDTTIKYDVGLLKMSSRVTPSLRISTICLMVNPRINLYGYQALLIGWGSKEEGRYQISDVLKKAYVPVISNHRCQHAYRNYRKISQEMLCAGIKNGDANTGMCNGDSGGPLVKRGTVLAQIGITSWSKGCARERKYGVFTRIDKVAMWIRSITTFETCP